MLKSVGGETEQTHHGEFTWFGPPIVGWLAARPLIKRPFERVIERHMGLIKKARPEPRVATSFAPGM